MAGLKFPHLARKPKLKRKKLSRKANDIEKLHISSVASLGCIIGDIGCCGRITIHHCGTGIGRKKDHLKTIPLCWMHHLGKLGVDGKVISKRAWQAKYGTETELLEKVRRLLDD